MKLHFEPNLYFQLQAIEVVCDLIRGGHPGTDSAAWSRCGRRTAPGMDPIVVILPQKLGHGFCEILTELRGPRF